MTQRAIINLLSPNDVMRRIIRDLLTPSPGATPYQAGVMAMAHAQLAALESYAMAAFITP